MLLCAYVDTDTWAHLQPNQTYASQIESYCLKTIMLDFFLYFSVTLCLADMGFLRYSILICILPLRFLAALAEILLLLNIHMYITKMSFYGFKLWTKNGTWLQNQSQIIHQKPSSGGNVSGWWEPTKNKICCIVTLTLLIFCMLYVFVLFVFFPGHSSVPRL